MKGEWGSHVRALSRHTDAILGAGVVGLVLLLIVPLTPSILDFLLCMSIVFSVMVLLLTVYVENVLEFSVFPSVLLFLTLFRLGLNVASTRMILIRSEAGDIIQTFGNFVIQGSEVVGLIVFVLLTVINFIVVTKGASRIAEVAARFTLEALPGKQLAIDHELGSGVMTQKEAREARKKIGAEADFYGSMDGASKFVKGDAIAGVIIILVNLIGGLATGMVAKGMSWHTCWKTISRLTIGDGLVSQIPALLVSVGAAIMVTRAAGSSLGKTMPRQVFGEPKVMTITGILLLLLSFVPGMPLWVVLPTSALLLVGGYYQKKGQKDEKERPDQTKGFNRLVAHPIEIQLGYQVVGLADALQAKLGEIRTKIATQVGLRTPSVHICSQSDLSPTGWAILIKGVKVEGGRNAELAVLTSCLIDVIKKHAHELINRQHALEILQEVKESNAAVVDELYPKKLSLGQILKVLQHLLKEGVPIRDSSTILEALADHAEGEKSDLDLLTEEVRGALSDKISEEFFGKSHRAHVITLDPKVEQTLALAKGVLRPKVIDQIAREIMQLQEKAKNQGFRAVIMTSTGSRAPLRRLIEKKLPELPILSYKEVGSNIELTPIGVVTNEVLI